MRTESGSRRRRFAISYVLSIALHLGALYVLLAVPVALSSAEAGDERSAPAVVVTVERMTRTTPPKPHAVPTIRPPVRIAQQRVVPTAAPVVAAPLAQRELAKPRVHAPLEAQPTPAPAQVAAVVTAAPATAAPTAVPTVRPTEQPTAVPTLPPTPEPTREPTAPPTPVPTQPPTPTPTQPPTPTPTREPTPAPTQPPTPAPTREPTPIPTRQPTPSPTREPTPAPTLAPTRAPTARPVATARAIAEATAAAASTGTAATAEPRPERTAVVAYAAPTPGPEQRNAAEILNARLKSLTLGAMLPNSTVVYSERHYVGDISDVIHQVQAEWLGKVAPPDVLAKVFGVIYKDGTLRDPASVTYLFKRSTLLGVPYCVGWMVVGHPLSVHLQSITKPDTGRSLPEGGYAVVAPCTEAKYKAITASQLPFPSPSPAVRPQAAH